jgi:predicted nucleic acid-binding protein
LIKKVLIDSCIWIDFFSNNLRRELISSISDEHQLCINDAIMSEVLPLLLHKKENRAADLLASQFSLSMNIQWQGIIDLQLVMIKAGINKVGVLDLIILQNAMQNRCSIVSADKHFRLMCDKVGIEILQ